MPDNSDRYDAHCSPCAGSDADIRIFFVFSNGEYVRDACAHDNLGFLALQIFHLHLFFPSLSPIAWFRLNPKKPTTLQYGTTQISNSATQGSEGHTHLTFAGSKKRIRLNRPWPANHYLGIEDSMQRGKDRPKAVPKIIRSSIGLSSVSSVMLVGVVAPLGKVECERPKRLRKPIYLEETDEATLVSHFFPQLEVTPF